MESHHNVKHSSYFGGEESRTWSGRDIERLISDVSDMKQSIREKEGVEDRTYVMLKEENSKLWYLLRAITGDETLKIDSETSNHTRPEIFSDSISPFKKPNF